MNIFLNTNKMLHPFMVYGPPETHIEPSITFHEAGAHDLDKLLKETIVYCLLKAEVHTHFM